MTALPGCITMEPLWWFRGYAVAATITLKNIPNDLYRRLKEVAELHHRSLNMEVIACLEDTLLPTRMTADERIARIRRVREGLPNLNLAPEDIQDAIEDGRP